jgi:hypothetical protein
LLNTRVALAGALIVKFPSASVTVAVVAPFTCTVTPCNAESLIATLPDILCCAKSVEEKENDNKSKKSNFLWRSFLLSRKRKEKKPLVRGKSNVMAKVLMLMIKMGG